VLNDGNFVLLVALGVPPPHDGVLLVAPGVTGIIKKIWFWFLSFLFLYFCFCFLYFLFLLHCSYRLFDFIDNFLFRLLVSCGGAWVCRDDFLDPGCEVCSHTSVGLGFVGDFLAHVFEELGPFLYPTRSLCRHWSRYTRLPPFPFIERSCDAPLASFGLRRTV